MISSDALVPAADIRAHFVDRLNSVLRRPGMWGDELALRMMCEDLLYVEGRPGAWHEQQTSWEVSGAWSANGAKGAFARHLHGDGPADAVVSLYAEFAHRSGWLRAVRVLDTGEYARLRATAPEWVGGADRGWSDVAAEFGPPSVRFGGSNPRFGKTLGYVTADPADPMVCFHLWNGTRPDSLCGWTAEHTEPVLLAVRVGGARTFRDSFTYTPEGERRRSCAREFSHRMD
ncbi:hypothetical protein [Streptomyces sp. AM 2-1-1]|uniref:hypothetical protein n=1 Tax=Streptomyces sp. AM 2-1-1 TaxID=3028709 RepID=UPI0023B8C164|nr:hypothetical protein [Streptomyces sp. AM 2-1-1]WEH41223.1 hypothetical protein PZB77_17920 [Streptomyces sp. AM 2-1-1]